VGGTPTRMRSNAVGGDSYFMLGVGGCNYDASTPSSNYEIVVPYIITD
jgi:hypothetical protein